MKNNIYSDLQEYLAWCNVNERKPQEFESLKDFNKEKKERNENQQ